MNAMRHVRYSNSWFACKKPMGVDVSSALLAVPADRSPIESSIVPVTVETKTQSTSQAKEPTSSTLMAFFACRTQARSDFRVTSARSSRSSEDVAITAPATSAAGAPRFAVHSKALNAMSATSAAPARGWRAWERGWSRALRLGAAKPSADAARLHASTQRRCIVRSATRRCLTWCLVVLEITQGRAAEDRAPYAQRRISVAKRSPPR
mmetsp:Transcript_25802/g.79384  ORF Transcript_25802/g.79384 Transcript_25802/m.79384 type:complete len:208 (-) Transcript_25802:228-851(-)